MTSSVDPIELKEFEARSFPVTELTERDAELLISRYNEKVEVQWPSKISQQWTLTAKSWVGYLPLADRHGIYLHPKISVRNLFGMIEYANELFSLYEGSYQGSSISEIFEFLAEILSKKIGHRIQKGLYKAYCEEHEMSAYIRGKIDFPGLWLDTNNSKLPCVFEDLTHDNTDNQILLWTLHIMLLCGLLHQVKISELIRKTERKLSTIIRLFPFHPYDCVGRTYTRLNEDYEVCHKLCRFFLENIGPQHLIGDRSIMPFIINMASLFEKFVARWLKENLSSNVEMKEQEYYHVGSRDNILMKMDMVICDKQSGRPLLVLDTKYKNSNRVSPPDFYQIVAYALKLQCKHAALIYPQQIEGFNETIQDINVRALRFNISHDLNSAGNEVIEYINSIISTNESSISVN